MPTCSFNPGLLTACSMFDHPPCSCGPAWSSKPNTRPSDSLTYTSHPALQLCKALHLVKQGLLFLTVESSCSCVRCAWWRGWALRPGTQRCSTWTRRRPSCRHARRAPRRLRTRCVARDCVMGVQLQGLMRLYQMLTSCDYRMWIWSLPESNQKGPERACPSCGVWALHSVAVHRLSNVLLWVLPLILSVVLLPGL